MGELFILIYLFIVTPQNARKKFEKKRREGDDFFITVVVASSDAWLFRSKHTLVKSNLVLFSPLSQPGGRRGLLPYSWVSRDVTSLAQVSVRHVGVPRVSNLC